MIRLIASALSCQYVPPYDNLPYIVRRFGMRIRSHVFQLAPAVTLLLLVFAPAVHAVGLGGTWTGQVTQSNTSETYPVEMHLYGSIGSIGYPTLGCGGNLEFMRSDGTSFWYRERLTHGRDKCIDGGVIEIRSHPLGDPTSWVWTWTGSGISVRGVLRGSGINR